MDIESGLSRLRNSGFLMQAALPVAELPPWALDPMVDSGIDPGRYRTLVMLGQAGPMLWEHIVASGRYSRDPFDDAAIELAEEFVTESLDGARWEVVFPGPSVLPLVRLAELVGWGSPSPLGMTINVEYGLWLAHRVVFLVDADIPAVTTPSGQHPCDSCIAKPCISACPVGAVDAISGFDVDSCSVHRLEVNSSCAFQCLARNACPIGVEYRYGPAQMSHHYASGLASIRAYYESEAPS